jgi:uncharacterized protein (DUF1499 family)
MGYRQITPQASRIVIWAERLAWFAVPVALLAILVTRSGQVAPISGVILLGGAALMAAIALALVAVGAVEIWRRGTTGLGGLFRASAVAVLVLAYPGWLAIEAGRLPRLNDITTDLVDPPVFSRSAAAMKARSGHVPASRDPREREPQRQAYPDIRPIQLDMEAEEAFQLVREVIRGLRWRVIEEIAPGGRSGQGRIEAIAETRLMRFQDDVTIRIRPSGAGTRVDIRSASRIGRHDFGANAARIRRFAAEINAPRD